ncbi:MAG: hypothetical protein ACNS62_24880 [Candidatus Cyclobacteriaceae bacterium M3_2C_046]
MDDYSLIIYIILGLIYLVGQFFKSKKDAATRRPEEEVERHDEFEQEAEAGPRQPKKRPSTFEDLLREFGAPVEPEDPESFSPAPEKAKPKPFEREDYDDEVKDIYEQAVETGKKLKTLDEQVKIEDTASRLKEVEQVTKKKAAATSKYAKLLRNRNNLKQAIIMKEILDRKHF